MRRGFRAAGQSAVRAAWRSVNGSRRRFGSEPPGGWAGESRCDDGVRAAERAQALRDPRHAARGGVRPDHGAGRRHARRAGRGGQPRRHRPHLVQVGARAAAGARGAAAAGALRRRGDPRRGLCGRKRRQRSADPGASAGARGVRPRVLRRRAAAHPRRPCARPARLHGHPAARPRPARAAVPGGARGDRDGRDRAQAVGAADLAAERGAGRDLRRPRAARELRPADRRARPLGAARARGGAARKRRPSGARRC